MSTDWQPDSETNEGFATDPRTGSLPSQANQFRPNDHRQTPTNQARTSQSGLRSHFDGHSSWPQDNDVVDPSAFVHQLNELSFVENHSAGPHFAYHNASDNAQVQSRTLAGPAEEITDTEFYANGIVAHKKLCTTEGDEEKLFPDFKKRAKPAEFFKFGKVFKVLWAEPAGETIVTSREPAAISKSRFGEDVHSKVRRLVVIRAGRWSCSALPITTYQGKGVAKNGVIKSNHSVIYTGKLAPDARPKERPQKAGELPMQSAPIRVLPDDKKEALDPMSRLDYEKIYTVEHYVKVKAFGVVHRPDERFLLAQFNKVWNTTFSLPVEREPSQEVPTTSDAVVDDPDIDREMIVRALVHRGYSEDEANNILDARQPQNEDEEPTETSAGGDTAASPVQETGFSLSPGNPHPGSSTQHEPRATSHEAQVQTQNAKDEATYQLLLGKGMSARQATAVLGKRRAQ